MNAHVDILRSGVRPYEPFGGRKRDFRVGPRMATSVAAIFGLVGLVGLWAATTELSGAVLTPGSVVVDQHAKSVQHRDGGVVGDIRVRDGDTVQAGQILIRIDDAQAKAELDVLRQQLLELSIKKARLLAERDGALDVSFPPPPDAVTASYASLVDGERRLFEGDLVSRDSRRRQLALQVDQMGEEISGMQLQKNAKDEELALLQEEHKKLRGLVDKRLADGTRFLPVSRDLHRLVGEKGALEASIARSKVRTSELELQIIAIDDEARTVAQRELSQVDARLSELQNRRLALEDRLSRTDIRAPVSGTLHELKTFTVGGVVTPADVLATIVPLDAKLGIEIAIPPTSVDQVAIGQVAKVRFTTFNQRTTPELKGHVTYLAPSTTKGPHGEPTYLARVALDQGELERLGEHAHLVPGMPVEVHVETQMRTALSYLLKPLLDRKRCAGPIFRFFR